MNAVVIDRSSKYRRHKVPAQHYHMTTVSTVRVCFPHPYIILAFIPYFSCQVPESDTKDALNQECARCYSNSVLRTVLWLERLHLAPALPRYLITFLFSCIWCRSHSLQGRFLCFCN